MKAIQVKYLAATNRKGSRLKAKAEGVPAITKGFNYSFNNGGALELAQELCVKYKWSTNLVGGTIPNGDSVFVFKNQ